MDYKTLVHDFNQNRKELVEFITLRNKRNISRCDEMVSLYVSQMATGDYSIKSYKAKIIHNELDCNHAIRDVIAVKDKAIAKITDLINNYFLEYLDSREDENFAKQKAKDTRDYVNDNRRQKHDVLLKKNNIDKDFNAKTKELENEKKEKLDSYNEKVNSLKMRLVSDLKRLNEKTIKDYSEFELALLDEVNKNEIKALKEKIKDIRRESIDEEYKIKMDTYEEILNEELTFTKSYQEFIYELEKYRKEMKESLARLECDNDLLTIDSEYQDKIYDLKYQKKANDNLKGEIDKFTSLVSDHNEFVKVDYNEHDYNTNEKMFVYNLAELKLYSLLIKIHKDNRCDPLALFLSYLASVIEKEKETYLLMTSEMKPFRDNKVSELVTALDGFTPNPKKKQTKEELTDNVVESLDRYFENYEKEIDFYNVIDSDLLYTTVKAIIDGYNSKLNTNNVESYLDIVTNYNYVDMASYGYKLEEEKTEVAEGEVVIPKEELLKKNLEELISSYKSSYEAENSRLTSLIDELNKDKEQKDATTKKACEDKINLYNEEYKETVEKNKKELLEKEKEVVKATSKSKDKAKKLLLENKKAL